MSGQHEKKSGPGIVVWIGLGLLGVLLVVGVAGSRKAPVPREAVPQEVKTLAIAPSVEVQLPEKEKLPDAPSEKTPIQAIAAISTKTRALISSSAPVTLESVKNLPGKLKLGLPVEMPGGEKVLPLQYTCYRANVSPPVQWTGAPAKSKSFVLLLERHEKDKPVQIRWAVFNIPAGEKALPANLPKQAEVFKDGTAQAQNDQGYAQYVGPCDAQGKVEYVFRLFALDVVLKVAPGAPKSDLIGAMNGHIADEADLAVIHYFRIK